MAQKKTYKVVVRLKGFLTSYDGGSYRDFQDATTAAEVIVGRGFWFRSTLYPPHVIDSVVLEETKE